MLFNEIKNLQQFIVPDVLNNSGLNNFSKGYIYNVEQINPYIFKKHISCQVFI